MVEREEIEKRIEQIRLELLVSQKGTSNLAGELARLEEKLDDLTKPRLTPDQIDEITDAIIRRVEDYSFDVGQFEFELDMDYDNTVQLCSLEFQSHQELSEIITESVLDLFGEAHPDDDIS